MKDDKSPSASSSDENSEGLMRRETIPTLAPEAKTTASSFSSKHSKVEQPAIRQPLSTLAHIESKTRGTLRPIGAVAPPHDPKTIKKSALAQHQDKASTHKREAAEKISNHELDKNISHREVAEIKDQPSSRKKDIESQAPFLKRTIEDSVSSFLKSFAHAMRQRPWIPVGLISLALLAIFGKDGEPPPTPIGDTKEKYHLPDEIEYGDHILNMQAPAEPSEPPHNSPPHCDLTAPAKLLSGGLAMTVSPAVQALPNEEWAIAFYAKKHVALLKYQKDQNILGIKDLSLPSLDALFLTAVPPPTTTDLTVADTPELLLSKRFGTKQLPKTSIPIGKDQQLELALSSRVIAKGKDQANAHLDSLSYFIDQKAGIRLELSPEFSNIKVEKLAVTQSHQGWLIAATSAAPTQLLLQHIKANSPNHPSTEAISPPIRWWKSAQQKGEPLLPAEIEKWEIGTPSFINSQDRISLVLSVKIPGAPWEIFGGNIEGDILNMHPIQLSTADSIPSDGKIAPAGAPIDSEHTLLQWTEGKKGNRRVMLAVLNHQGIQVADPIQLSPPTVDAGKGQPYLSTGKGFSSFYVHGPHGFELWIRNVQCNASPPSSL